jgi:predicted  nucleic acid-binding Zn-ribbon protein
VLPALATLIALQQLDTAADAARRRLNELPAAEQALAAELAAATAAVDAAKARAADNQTKRRALEKDVAGVDTRLARFDDHKAAVKTNQEYTALLHEISTAKAEKDGIEEQILGLMEEADGIARDQKAAEAAMAQTKRDAGQSRAAFARERATLEEDFARLTHDRQLEAKGVEPALLKRYEQLLKQRRGVAVAAMTGEMCAACHVRQRPHIAQLIRQNVQILQCESCQRILYYKTPA